MRYSAHRPAETRMAVYIHTDSLLKTFLSDKGKWVIRVIKVIGGALNYPINLIIHSFCCQDRLLTTFSLSSADLHNTSPAFSIWSAHLYNTSPTFSLWSVHPGSASPAYRKRSVHFGSASPTFREWSVHPGMASPAFRGRSVQSGSGSPTSGGSSVSIENQ